LQQVLLPSTTLLLLQLELLEEPLSSMEQRLSTHQRQRQAPSPAWALAQRR